MKHGSICIDMLIPKATDSGHLWIQDLFMKLHCMIWKCVVCNKRRVNNLIYPPLQKQSIWTIYNQFFAQLTEEKRLLFFNTGLWHILLKTC
jgi:hypothetical protein